MVRCRSRAVSARHVLSVALLLVVPAVVGAAAPALAASTQAAPPGLGAWLADTGAHALRAAEPDNDAAAGGGEALNRGIRSGFSGLQQTGPTWMRRVTVDLRYRDDRQAASDVTVTQPLIRSWDDGDRLWLQSGLTRDPGGWTGSRLGLYYRPGVTDDDLTLAVTGTVEDHWLQDYQRFGIGTELRSDSFELGTSVFDDVAGQRNVGNGVPERRLDGYGIVFGARLPELPWAWVRVRKQWQIPVESEQASTSDRLSLQLGPLVPLEVETGTDGDGDNRSWFAQLRLRIPLGDGR